MAFMLQTAPSLLNVRQPLLITAIATALLAGCATRSEPPAAAVSEPAQPAKTEQGTDEAAMESPIQASNFAHWKQEFAPRARAAGISERTLRSALAGAKLQPSIIKLDRSPGMTVIP